MSALEPSQAEPGMDFWFSVCSSQEADRFHPTPSPPAPMVPGEHPAIISSRKESSPFAVEEAGSAGRCLGPSQMAAQGRIQATSRPTTVTVTVTKGFL